VKLIVGLGNPGREYEQHRHNIGFRVVDALAKKAGVPAPVHKWQAEVARGQDYLLLKPQTFMNLSGQAVAEAARFYKISSADTLVVHDELDLPFARLQLKSGGGTGGHNGLTSICECWGDDAFGRLRFGIGKPAGQNAKERVTGHVLSNFSTEEQPALPDLIARSVDGCQLWLVHGMQTAMNRFNRK
jgi:PTH1 family peptidyl-tRNA hydrolase